MKKLVLLIILIVGLGYLALTNPDTDDAKVFYAQQQCGETDSGENNLMNSIWGFWATPDQEDVCRENYVFFSLYDFGNECHLIGIAGPNFMKYRKKYGIQHHY